MKKIDQTHEKAREVVEKYLIKNGREILADNSVQYPPEFIKKHKLEKRFRGHSYDIWTGQEIIEITDYGKHSKTNQKINDGIVQDFTKQYLPNWNFYVLQKEEIVDTKGHLQPTAADYLKEHLF